MKTMIFLFLLCFAFVFSTSCSPRAEFTLGQLAVTPATVAQGQEAAVSLVVSNVGKGEGQYEAVLAVNGVNSETQSATVPPGASQTMVFKIAKPDLGPYTVTVGGQSATLQVVKPAEFKVTSLQVPLTAVPGTSERMTVRATVTNVGGIEGTYRARLLFDGQEVEAKDVALRSGESQTVEFDPPIKYDAGSHTVAIGDQSSTLQVIKPAEFKLTSLQAPLTAIFGLTEKVAVSATVTNIGGIEGTYNARLTVDGQEVDSRDVVLDSGQSQTVSFNLAPGKAGPMQVAIGGLSATVVVIPPRPTLISPANGAVLDNGRTDFKDDEVWDFDWEHIPGVTRYELYVIGANAIYPVIDGGIATSFYHSVDSGYIADQNRYGWTWKVRAYAGGQWGEWSEVRTFDVEPVNTDPPAAASSQTQ